MVAAHVVVEPARQSRHRGAEKISLGRMQVAARRIAAQRPAVAGVRFPRREPEGELEEDGDVIQLDGRGRRESSCAHIGVARRERIGHERQRKARRAFERAKRIRLVRPVQPAGPGRIAAQAVLAALVVFDEGSRLRRIGDRRHGASYGARRGEIAPHGHPGRCSCSDGPGSNFAFFVRLILWITARDSVHGERLPSGP